MPRKSSAALSVVSVIPGVRAQPPKRLSPEQAEIWREAIASKPANWFDAASLTVLEAYCHAVANYRALTAGGTTINARKLAMIDRQARLVMTIATKLRFTQQSRIDRFAAHSANKRAGEAVKPWEIQDENAG